VFWDFRQPPVNHNSFLNLARRRAVDVYVATPIQKKSINQRAFFLLSSLRKQVASSSRKVDILLGINMLKVLLNFKELKKMVSFVLTALLVCLRLLYVHNRSRCVCLFIFILRRLNSKPFSLVLLLSRITHRHFLQYLVSAASRTKCFLTQCIFFLYFYRQSPDL